MDLDSRPLTSVISDKSDISDAAVIKLHRYRRMDASPEEEKLSIVDFNMYFDFKDCFNGRTKKMEYIKDPALLVAELPLGELMNAYTKFTKKALVQIGALHGLSSISVTNVKKGDLIVRLKGHICMGNCGATIYVFKSRPRARPVIPSGNCSVFQGIAPERTVGRHAAPASADHPPPSIVEEEDLELAEVDDFDHLKVLDDGTKLDVIREWQTRMSFDRLTILVCCSCGTRVQKSSTYAVDGRSIDLTLLRNDELPEIVRPSSYNFIAYKRAILNPEGLSDRTVVADMTFCQSCYNSLSSGSMPKFALCNWLYYGKEALPNDVKTAFAEASMFERMLVSRARCNSICCRFQLNSQDNEYKRREGLQKGIRGNIMVAPLNAIRLHAILPPKIDIKDTMTAVIVGDKMPTKDTINRLGPVLVRKSRIRLLLQFLMENNPHYKPGDDLFYSRENIDAIHDSGEDADVPSTVTIGHLADHGTVDNINADYTPRNEEEWIPANHINELMMENVGYTEGDNSPAAYSAMKILALQRCLSGKPFVASGTGNKPVPDFNNPSILTWLFPHLDPWGIGGFHDKRRKIKISMREQLSHLLNSSDTTFVQDPELAFVLYNSLQKGDVFRNVFFRVSRGEKEKIIKDLQTISVNELRLLSLAVEKNPMFKPEEPEQKKIMSLLQRVTMTTHSLPGSNGYKMNMRRNVRSIINAKGAPTLFITLNPSDVHNPIVRILGGAFEEIDVMLEGEDVQSWRRRIYAAKNPSACAKFFDLLVTTFIDVVLRYGRDQPGLYGYCEAYYGVVEAQGKGTLHLHLLVWLRGHLSPQLLQERLRTSSTYKEHFVQWLESIIKNEFPTLHDAQIDEPSREKRERNKDLGEPHPGTIPGPSAIEPGYQSSDEFWIQYKHHLIRLLNEYNWHEHTGTCWKYLKRGEEKKDSNCRMRMDGSTCQKTVVDVDTGHFQLRRLHPWISSYTDVVTFLMKCNMNIQFIGTGTEAKAFIYYVTDYVTKACLPLHAGLAAIAYALKKIGEMPKKEGDDSEKFYTSALIKFVNSMMGKQEISHQQVMSYLVGGGDCYTSERFQSVHLTAFLKHIATLEQASPPLDSSEGTSEDVDMEGEDTVILTVDQDGPRIDSQVLDYIHRPSIEPYASMVLYDFMARTTKVKVKKADSLIDSPQAFTSWTHPQRGTHRVSMRSNPVLPVILGPTLPNRGGSSTTSDAWAKHVLILFKPWRSVEDLRPSRRSWGDAFDAFEKEGLRNRHAKIIQNMQLLTECADARFKQAREIAELNQLAESIVENTEIDENAALTDQENEDEDIQQWKSKFCSDAFAHLGDGSMEIDDSMPENVKTRREIKDLVGGEVMNALESCMSSFFAHEDRPRNDEPIQELLEPTKAQITAHSAIMQKKRKRIIADSIEDVSEPLSQRRRIDEPFVDIGSIPMYAAHGASKYERILQEIVSEMNLENNKEQLEAFLTVARHVGERDPEQLLMFVSGVGGTGKSHVIKSIVKLFERLNRRHSLLLGAPTGNAAILIGGSTLHSLILETPNAEARRNVTKLARIWNRVLYLIIDEVSMISSVFLSKLSEAMKQAKGDNPEKAFQIFGGVHVIFMGDFCQLKPARDLSLFSSKLTNRLSEITPNASDISGLNGVFLWRQVTRVVELVKNCRHAEDTTYSDFLSRMRIGKCSSPTSDLPAEMDDYRYIQSRLLTNIFRRDPEELKSFMDAPFIVGTKELRDYLNARMAAFHASRAKKTVHIYFARDSTRRQSIPAGSAEILWSMQSTHTRDAIGRLPLFEGMKVMITENIAFDSKVVNGTEGVVRKIIYDEDEAGRRYATVAYVYIEGIGFQIEGLEMDVVPIFPARTSIALKSPHTVGLKPNSFTRWQLPLVPAYAYTDYKSQGRTLVKAIVDIASAKGQGAYVMLSRVTSLSGLAILRWFPPSKIYQRCSAELRTELSRLGLRH